MEFIKKYYFVILLLLYLLGVLAAIGVYSIYSNSKGVIYNKELLLEDIFRYSIAMIFPMIYPIHQYIKYWKKNKDII